METRIELPENWEWTQLSQLCLLLNGDRGKNYPSRDKQSTEGFPFVNAGHLENDRILMEGMNFVDDERFSLLRSGKFNVGDILFCIRGSLGKVALNTNIEHGAIASSLIIVRPRKEIDTRYVLYYLASPLCTNMIRTFDNGTAQPNLSGKDLGRFEVPLPPYREQLRIVAKIEELLSELDNGVEGLKTAQKQLQVYRQAVLKHAFEGKLTVQWRDDNAATLKNAAGNLAEVAVGGAEIPDPERENRPALPRGWAYVRLGRVIDEPKYGTSKKCDYETRGVGVIRIPNIVSGFIDASDLKFAQFNEDEIQAYGLRRGDILIIRSNGSISIVGKCAIVSEGDEEYLYAGYLIRIRPNKKAVDSDYLHSVLSSHALRVQIEAKAKSTSGVNNINSGELQSLIVPLCCIEEQTALLAKLSQALSRVDQLEMEIDLQLKKADTLRQSILKNALSGVLVSQDPNDEAASALLERLRNGGTEKENGKKKIKRKDAA
jgi:type I restriction enzyme S subunit